MSLRNGVMPIVSRATGEQALGFGDGHAFATHLRFRHVRGVIGDNHHLADKALIADILDQCGAMRVGAIEFQRRGCTP